ncbi:MAG TPA: hypothetical protein DCM40_09945 [Maribacter sp.]|nr:hypothetical protein [Maribacter sp.]
MQLGKLLRDIMPNRGFMTKEEIRINNTKIALKLLLKQQKATRSPSLWQSYEDEIILLRKKLGELSNE